MTTFAAAAERAAGVVSAVLGWRPSEFWEATPAEVVMALRGVAGPVGEAVGSEELAALKERFPDG